MDDKIDHIMDTFDFKELEEKMTALQWRWYSDECTKLEVPSERQLRQAARRLLKEAANQYKVGWAIATGGFKATHRVDEEGRYLTLEFILMESYV